LRVYFDGDLLMALLQEFAIVFAMPPPHSRDHRINLIPGSAPVAVRPYRYPGSHKDELECQCAATLGQGLIRCSTSTFSSPVLLVKKPDGTWSFCIDYRALNAIIIKDAYPIPVGDELLDKLLGTRFFTKLDLHSGYHQVRMNVTDIAKIAFWNHDGLYEFPIMSFWLCNAPAMFQDLINNILRSFLHHFVLVLLDEILILSGRLTSSMCTPSSTSSTSTSSSSSGPSASLAPHPSPT
jgi:hypothetical protein